MLRNLTHTLRGQILVLTALFVCALPLVTTRIYASDEVQYYAYLRSLWFDRDVSFENEYQHFYDAGVTQYEGFHETFLERATDTGLRNTFATIGSALLWSPFFAAADLIVHVRRAMGAAIAADGYSQPYIAAVAYGSAVYGWLSLVLSLFITRRVLGESRLIAAVAIWIGTPLFFYMYIAPPMSHGCSAFAVAAFVLVWLRVRRGWNPGGMIALGALAALMAMVREQDVFIAIGPAVDWAIDLWIGQRLTSSPRLPGKDESLTASRGLRESPLASRAVVGRTLLFRGVLGALAFGVAYLPQLTAYRVINGYFGPSRLVARKLNWMAPHAWGVLASPEHGLVFWTPLVVLSLIGLGWLALRSEQRRVGVCLLLMVLSQIYIAGSVESWTVAGAFGQRRFVGLTSLFVLGLAAVWMRAAAARRVPRLVCATALALGVWWNLGLMAQFGAGLMDRQRLELGRNAYQTFVTIPRRVPDLAYRYVFARHSFYKTEPHER